MNSTIASVVNNYTANTDGVTPAAKKIAPASTFIKCSILLIETRNQTVLHAQCSLGQLLMNTDTLQTHRKCFKMDLVSPNGPIQITYKQEVKLHEAEDKNKHASLHLWHHMQAVEAKTGHAIGVCIADQLQNILPKGRSGGLGHDAASRAKSTKIKGVWNKLIREPVFLFE